MFSPVNKHLCYEFSQLLTSSSIQHSRRENFLESSISSMSLTLLLYFKNYKLILYIQVFPFFFIKFFVLLSDGLGDELCVGEYNA